MTAPKDPAAPAKPRHLGTLIMEARQAAGCSRHAFCAAVGLSDTALKSIEIRTHLPTREQLDKVLAHSAMRDLLARAEREGIKVELEPAVHPNPSGHRVKGGS